MAYTPIQNYGVIGDLHTVALVSLDGSIDWFCAPRFDAPSVFARLLDDKKGGHYRIAPCHGKYTTKQLYWPDTNVLITRFLAEHGVAEVIDFMPAGMPADAPGRHQILRFARAVRGSVDLRLECYPAFDYARATHETVLAPRGALFRSAGACLGLSSVVPLAIDGTGVASEFTLNEGHSTMFALGLVDPKGSGEELIEASRGELCLSDTVQYWRRWLSQCSYRGRWREMVNRSALTLKLMTYEPTGAIVAAPTTSLPEALGGTRNWDYRYTWIRDAAFTLYALLRIGFTHEATAFMLWLDQRCHEPNPDGTLQIVYGIDGRHDLPELSLDHLSGYHGSRPVRIGNAASQQLQLDIYGELLDAAYLFNKYGRPISYDLWQHLRRFVDWLCDNWQRPDEGIWEVRGGQRHFVYSKLMCWVAIDRGLRLADKRSFPADRVRWQAVRDQIYTELMDRGYSQSRRAFVQSYGSDALDAANLMMPLVFFLSPTDPRNLSTLDAVMKTPANGGLVANNLVYRYNTHETPDGIDGHEGTFNICTFWLVEALTRASQADPKRLDQALMMFEQMLGYANHLGLYAEETGSEGQALGNFPQAFTHLSLISAAFNLDRTLDRK